MTTDRAGQGPLLFQINARTFVRSFGPEATLDNLTDDILAATIPAGTDIVWFLGVWTVGAASRAISRADPDIRRIREQTLPDGSDDDIAGSCFSIAAYEVAPHLGGDAALARLRARLAAAGHRLMLDFVPNHTAPDHPWVTTHPEHYIQGTEADLAAAPENWRRIDPAGTVIALGRDPYFPGWKDVLQLDYSNAGTRAEMAAILVSIARRADAIRADMAMLVLPEIIDRVWHRTAPDFWTDAIAGARAANPGLLLMAEVYWGLEPELRARGFDLVYDKPFLDALAADDHRAVRAALSAPLETQCAMARFLENHDEPRAAATFPWERLRPAVAILLTAPGLRFLQLGQIEGARIHVSMHLGRAPVEPPDPESVAFHHRLLACLAEPAFRHGRFEPLEPLPAWDGNPSQDRFVLTLWRDDTSAILLACNTGSDRAQCRVRLPDVPADCDLVDLLGPETYRRDGPDMAEAGLFLDLSPRTLNLFRITPVAPLDRPS